LALYIIFGDRLHAIYSLSLNIFNNELTYYHPINDNELTLPAALARGPVGFLLVKLR